MVSYQVDLLMVESSTFFSLRLSNGAALVPLKKCTPSPQQKFPVTSPGETIATTPDTLLEEFKQLSGTAAGTLGNSPRAVFVKHRGTLCIRLQLLNRSQVYPLTFLSSATIQHLLSRHYIENNFVPLLSVATSSLTVLNQHFAFLPSSSAQYEHIFRNNFWTEISPLLKLKLDVYFGKVPRPLSPMTESPPAPKKSSGLTMLQTNYLRGGYLGEGTYGQVYEIKLNSSSSSLALKIMRKTPKEEFGTFFKTLLSETSGLALCSSFYDIKISDPHTLHLLMPMYGKNNLDKFISALRSHSNYSSVTSPVQAASSSSSSYPPCTPSSLQEVSRKRMLSAEQHLGIFRGIVSVLHKLHRKGMAHLDVKMCNIIGPRDDFSCRLIDFGLCSLQEGPQNEVLKTTLDTRDPAIFQGKECFTWSDIWSLGVIFSDLVAEKRFSIISYRKPGFWPDGKKYDWDKDENKLCLKFIEERVNDDEVLDSFLQALLEDPQENPNLSIGTAYVLSSCLWKNPGKRNSLGLLQSSLSPGLAKWPFPIFTSGTCSGSAPTPPTPTPTPTPTPAQHSFRYLIQEKHRGHYTLNGSGPFSSLHDIPVLPTIRGAVVEEKRRFQLHFIASVLLDLREFNLKTFLLAVDILDRVSSPCTLEHIKSSMESTLGFIALESACIFFALLQSCPYEPGLETVMQKTLENLPIEYIRAPFCLKESVPKLWELILNLLSTVRFQQNWTDSLWNELVCLGKFNSSGFVKGIFEGLLCWPDGKQTTSEFLSAVVSCSQTSIFAAPVPLRKTTLQASWITPEFQCLISSSNFWDVYIFSPRSSLPPLPDSPPSSPSSSKLAPSFLLSQYLDTFSETRQHPFLIPFPTIPGITRSEFILAVDDYMKKLTVHIPREVCEGKKCIVCTQDSVTSCTACEQWSLCSECTLRWGGRCTQCLVPSEVTEWRKISMF